VGTDSPETAKDYGGKNVILFGFVHTSDLCDVSVADGVSLVPESNVEYGR